MNEPACGYHALDPEIHDDCPYCTRIRLAVLVAAFDAKVVELTAELDEAREAARWMRIHIPPELCEKGEKLWPWLKTAEDAEGGKT